MLKPSTMKPLVTTPLRAFPRSLHREQQLQRQSKYARMREPEPEKAVEEADARKGGSRKEYEMYREGERLYARFQEETGAQDREQEKEIERLIEEKMAQGLDDATIMDQIINGGQATVKEKDRQMLEDEKIRELMEELHKQGKSPVTLDQSIMFGDQSSAEQFESF